LKEEGRIDEAKEIISKMAKFNGIKLHSDSWSFQTEEKDPLLGDEYF
jgi:hypothetical protein